MNVLKGKLGVLGLALVFGLGLFMTACELSEGSSRMMSLRVFNNSEESVELSIIQRDPDGFVHWRPPVSLVPRGSSHSSHIPGDVRVEVRAGNRTFHYPLPAGAFRHMEGTVTLTFTGDRIRGPQSGFSAE